MPNSRNSIADIVNDLTTLSIDSWDIYKALYIDGMIHGTASANIGLPPVKKIGLFTNCEKWISRTEIAVTYKRKGILVVVDANKSERYFQEQISNARKLSRSHESKFKRRFGVPYETVGGTFCQPGTIANLAEIRERIALQSKLRTLERDKKPRKTDKSNNVGVEIEFVSTLDASTLSKYLVKAGLASFVTLKTDGSIRTYMECPACDGYQCECDRENEECSCDCICSDDSSLTKKHCYGHEVTLIAKESNVKERLQKLLTVINSVGEAQVNKSCGLHVHLDMRHRWAEDCYNRLTEAQPLLYAMVPKSRFHNDYCHPSVGSFTCAQDGARYHGVNATAYRKHKTLEVRMHSGTTNFSKISHWIDLLVAIVSTKVRFDELVEVPLNAEALQSWLPISDATAKYVFERIAEFKGKRADYGVYLEPVPKVENVVVDEFLESDIPF